MTSEPTLCFRERRKWGKEEVVKGGRACGGWKEGVKPKGEREVGEEWLPAPWSPEPILSGPSAALGLQLRRTGSEPQRPLKRSHLRLR